jgi:nucleoside-diphosphate-sugar epimerase
MSPGVARAFVAGATGFVGRALVQALVARGVETTAHVRPDSGRLEEWRTKLGALGAKVDATAWDADALGATLTALAPTHVFCTIGTTRNRAKADAISGDIYQAVDVGLTRKLVAGAVASGAKPRLIVLSSIGASAKSASAYLKARAQAEQFAIDSGLSWAIARPSFIVGDGREDRRRLEDATAAVANGVLGALGALGAKKLRDKYRSIGPDALAAQLVRLGLDETADRVYEAGDLR